MTVILQKSLGFAPWMDPRTRRLPGVIPLEEADWLQQDDAFAAQMALREQLITERPEAVHRLSESCLPAAQELYDRIFAQLPGLGYQTGQVITRPDGGEVVPDRNNPLLTLGRLVAEDLCLMQAAPADSPDHGEHLLGGAILCFPAGWTLAQKWGRPMMRIHKPVAKYTEDVGKRVQRLLDGIRPGIGMLRGTAHQTNATLHNPLTEEGGRKPQGALPYIRVERQSLFRLPETGAVVFSIHTSMILPENLTPAQQDGLREWPIHQSA